MALRKRDSAIVVEVRKLAASEKRLAQEVKDLRRQISLQNTRYATEVKRNEALKASLRQAKQKKAKT